MLRMGIVFSASVLTFCAQPKPEVNAVKSSPTVQFNFPEFDYEGHRGCRGLRPENTLPAFVHALELGVTTLEMDVVISADRQVVVSHEPYFNPEICQGPQGETLSDKPEENNLYQLNYAQIARYDCGVQQHPLFPDQQNEPAPKPLLSEVIATAEAWCKANNRPLPYYNIETKCTPAGDNVFHPDPASFANLLLAEVNRAGIAHRTIIQSFDARTLQHLNQPGRTYALSMLVEDDVPLDRVLKRLGFVPEVYSPWFKLTTPELVEACHQRGMKVIPWTLNTEEEMQQAIGMGVDGIISDYPNLFSALRKPSGKL